MKSIHEITEVEGDTIHYWTYGDTANPPLLMVHGFTGSHEGFQYIVPLLKDYFVIIPDLPGFGESELWEGEWTTHELARRVNLFVSTLKLPKVPYLVSHSLGGLIAASMLEQKPQLFARKTVFISPVATKIKLIDSRKIGAVLGKLQYAIGKRTGNLGRHLVKSHTLSKLATKVIMTENDPAKQAVIYSHHYKNLDHISSIDFYHQLYGDIIRRGALDHVSSLKKFDVLIIAGDKDNVTPLAGEKKLAHTINATLEIIPGVGHLAHYERPERIADALIDFLR